MKKFCNSLLSLALTVTKKIILAYKYIVFVCLVLWLFKGVDSPEFNFSLDVACFFGKILLVGIIAGVIIITLSLAKTQSVKSFHMPNDLIREMKNGVEEIVSKEFRKYSEEDKRQVRIAAIENNYAIGKVKYYYVFKKYDDGDFQKKA